MFFDDPHIVRTIKGPKGTGYLIEAGGAFPEGRRVVLWFKDPQKDFIMKATSDSLCDWLLGGELDLGSANLSALQRQGAIARGQESLGPRFGLGSPGGIFGSLGSGSYD